MMRKIFLFGGLFLLLLGAVWLWRVRHPRLSDSQQISANLDAITLAASEGRTGGIIGFLSPSFRWAGGKRSNLRSALAAGMTQYRSIELGVSGIKIGVNGDAATSEGNYRLSLKKEYDSPAEIVSGKFKLKWRREDGEWLVTQMEGEGESLPQ